jgi:hypothetical protein
MVAYWENTGFFYAAALGSTGVGASLRRSASAPKRSECCGLGWTATTSATLSARTSLIASRRGSVGYPTTSCFHVGALSPRSSFRRSPMRGLSPERGQDAFGRRGVRAYNSGNSSVKDGWECITLSPARAAGCARAHLPPRAQHRPCAILGLANRNAAQHGVTGVDE